MKPNLKSYHAISMRFFTTLALTDDLISRIQNISPPDEDGDSAFFDSYEGHRVHVWVVKENEGIDKDVRRFRIHFNYEQGRGGRLRKSTPQVEQLLDILSSIEEKMDFDCQVAFEFGKRLKPKPIISLPIKYTESPNMPFDIIQGLRLVKLDDKKWKYDAILEAVTAGTIMANISFSHTSEIQESLANKILEEGAAIAESFVSKEQ